MKDASAYPFQICVFANTVFLAVCIVLSILTETSSTSQHVKNVLADVYVLFASFLNFLIAVLLGFFGGKFNELCKADKVTRSVLPRSERMFQVMNGVLVCMYATRGVLTIVVGMGLTHLPSDGEMTYMGPHGRTPLFPFFYYIMVELIPVAIVLATLWQPLRIEKKSRDESSSSELGNSEMDAKYMDMFSPAGSHVSRDGDDGVTVSYAKEVLRMLKVDALNQVNVDAGEGEADAPGSEMGKLSSDSTSPSGRTLPIPIYLDKSPDKITQQRNHHRKQQQGKDPSPAMVSDGRIFTPDTDTVVDRSPPLAPIPSYAHRHSPQSLATCSPLHSMSSSSSPPSQPSSVTPSMSAWMSSSTQTVSTSSALPPVTTTRSNPSASSDTPSVSLRPPPHPVPPRRPQSHGILAAPQTGSPKFSTLSRSAEDRAAQQEQYAKTLGPRYILKGRKPSPKPRSNSGT
eukprot:CAMPEP_0185028800 /NCGR_PEP_ID=MMETSP1103-20130426/14802_1 /TAXON_ID=36769 /ORGANISM="Paraphysomonas bandaiensis, Strain Caron Lab Isolate" /LENGTH=457 /DNA_ID=CAMNT_0027563335 /DNA_START=545 /DNA_END=1918 /DNA_ORIENTATION=+